MSQRTKRYVGIVGITLVVYLGMRYLLPAVAPFFAAFLLVKWIYPAASRIAARLPVKKEMVTLAILLAGTGSLAGVLWYLALQLCRQVRSMLGQMGFYQEQLEGVAGQCCLWVEDVFGIESEQVMDFINQNLERGRIQIQNEILPNLMQHSLSYAAGILKIVGVFFLVFVAVLLLMKDYEAIKEKLEGWRGYEQAVHIVNRLWSLGGVYLKAQFLLMLIVMVLCVVGLFLIGNPYALLVGILIGALDVLPFIGTGTILVPWSILSLLRGDFFHGAAYFTLFLVANGVREYLEPRLVGERMGVYPIVIALVVYSGIWVYGVSGVLLGPLSLLTILECIREIWGTPKEDSAKEERL